MDLYVMRHSTAAENPPRGSKKDSDRPLTPKGERKAWRVAEALEAFGCSFDLIVSSPYVRARQTAEIVASAFNLQKQLVLSPHLAPSGEPRSLLEYVSGHKPSVSSVLLVGHEPYLGELVSMLVFGARTAGIAFKKGGVCKLACGDLINGRCATLEWLLTPKQMALIV